MILLLLRTAIEEMREVEFNLSSIEATMSPAMKLCFVHAFLSVLFIPLFSFWAIALKMLKTKKLVQLGWNVYSAYAK